MREKPVLFFPMSASRRTALAVGFRFGDRGTHTSRTMMLDELATVLNAVPAEMGVSDYANAVVEENCLSKQTVSTRRLSLQRLRELYGLDPSVPLFRIMRGLWDVDTVSRPLLALLTALARDPLMLASAEVIVNLREGSELQRNALRQAIANSVGDRLNESTLDKVVRNVGSSWSQSGHLEGRTFKVRRMVHATAPSVAFALYLADAVGFNVAEGLSSGWLNVLDCSPAAALDWAGVAKRMGLLDLKMAGAVIDLRLDRLDPTFIDNTGAR